MSALLRWDTAVMYAINGLAGRHQLLDALLVGLTYAGSGGAIFLALAAWLALRRRWPAVLHVLGAMALGGLLEELLKALIMRPRPSLLLPPGSLHLLVAVPTSSAFPSGHATAAVAAAVALWQRDRALGLLPGLLAVLIAYSRVFVGVHWPSDVLAGALLGTASAWAAGRLLAQTLKRK